MILNFLAGIDPDNSDNSCKWLKLLTCLADWPLKI